MRIDSFCDASPCVAQNHLDAGVIDPSRVEHAGYGVATLMGRVVHGQRPQHSVETAAKAVVGRRDTDVFPGKGEEQ